MQEVSVPRFEVLNAISTAEVEKEVEEYVYSPQKPAWKRGLDLLLIFLAMPVLLPLFAVIGSWIKLTSRGPVFFSQPRVGLGGSTFTILKFRSMYQNAETRTHENYLEHLVASNKPMVKMDSMGDRRLIPGGGILRASGLDELPQLINVVRGEMSLTGPRPCTTKEFPLFSPEQKQRFDSLPGLTGYWQVKGKNTTTFTEMIEMDRYYVDHCSFLMDLSIILQTPRVLWLQLLDNLRKRTNASPIPGGNDAPVAATAES